MKSILLSLMAMLCLYTAKAQPTAGLVAYWPMNGNFNDAGPNAIHGTNIGATTTTNRAGSANSAIAFSNPGSTVVQYASHPIRAQVNFSGTQDFTYTFSFYLNSPWVHTGGFYDNNLNYGGPGIWIWQSGSPTDYRIQFNYKNQSIGSTPQAVGTWIRVACVRAAGAIRIYINGALNASGTEGTTAPTYTYTPKFGTMFFNGMAPPQYNGFNGKLDELRIYNRALTAAEILIIATLPVKLNSFTAIKVNNDVQLQWQTALEQNSDYFNIQRSTDGVNFSTIGSVNAAGNSSIPINYRYTDNSLAALQNVPHVFYRLESVDIDAKKEYSAIVNIKLDKSKTGLMIMQNPVGRDLRIQYTSIAKENTNVIITDGWGRQVITRELPAAVGSISTTIPVSNIASGHYYLTIRSASQQQTQAFFKE